ncbi:MAG: hypothetical protein EA393_00830 [Bacteroidetes bacterium]|nr:MAG: hypothetical protein EA393_00830 [Bacteroidota bacterium]
MKLSLTVISILIFLRAFSGEPPGMTRDFKIPASQRVQQLDTLSIIADSFFIFGPDGEPLNAAFYEIDFITARIQLRIPEFWLEDSLRVTYRAWPVNFSKPLFVRDTSLIRLPGPGEDPVSIPVRTTIPEQGLLRFEGLQSSGSITRGLTLGNRQDATLSSAMNLQLSGMLTEEIEILAVISDQNIPFQPEGTTQQIQDFDRVFIQLSGGGAQLTAGDFEIEKPSGHFLNINRKARGASISYASAAEDSLIPGGGKLRTSVAGAISRGKYARNQIQGMEGNQGPYRLRGTENESFIIILAGTERVFVDGILLTRGVENDYIIDYNLAEITFMPSRLITRDSRIIVEFEYAERNYARSMLFTSNEVIYEKGTLRINFFSEQDHRNQPLFQEISDERKALMASVGDSIHRAFDWNFDSTGFKNDRVMYRMTDTLGFDTVFVFSKDPEQAVYQVGFTFVGEGNGNYRQISSSANGRVYQWQAPLNGIPQGTHEPIIQLVTPKRQQLLSLGGDIRLTSQTRANVEYAFSNRDLNLFSDLDKDNNPGHAFRLSVIDERGQSTRENPGWKYTTEFSYELAGQNFNAPERYREVEFERDWNLHTTSPTDEHLPGFSFTARHAERGMARYRFQAVLAGNQYSGYMNRLNTHLHLGKNILEYQGSLLNSEGFRKSDFYRHRAGYTRNLGFINAGFIHLMEDNKIRPTREDTLSLSSFSFEEREIFISNPDTSANTYRVFYKQRIDRLPVGNIFERGSMAHDYGLRYNARRNPMHRYSFQFVYRELEIEKEQFPGEQSERALNARIDHFLRPGQGVFTSNIFYEAISSMERKREYIYVEVPAGQGVYVWIDYNENGIMELDEFEIAPYPDEANFIRVFVPTDDFIRTYSTAISQSINLEPAQIWRQAEGWRKFVSRFSNRLNYRIDKKNQGGLAPENFNPFFTDIADSLLITLNASVRNSLFFNRTSPLWSIEWTVMNNATKSILSNGFESRDRRSQIWRARWNVSRQVSLHMNTQHGNRINESEFFARRNFNIRFYELEPSLNLQARQNLRFTFFYGFSNQENTQGETGEKARIHKAGLETRMSFPSRGNLQFRYQLSQIDYPFAENTPVAFEMLQALRPGSNNIWSINWQHNISSYLQLNLNYNGRKPPDVPAIHTGTVQLRALF